MTPQERDLISGLFERLQPFERQMRDVDAERLIGDLVARQPASPYLMAQTLLVQEQALKAAQERIAGLEGKSGFMANAPSFGPWEARAQGAVPAAPPPHGGGFLRTALATAAGVAGGMLLFEGVRQMFGGHQSGPWNQAAAPLLGPNDEFPAGDFAATDFSAADLAGDDGSADDYNLTDDSSGFDDI